MNHQIFAALFVIALIGQHLASAAPLSDNKQHHQQKKASPTSVKEIENMLNELEDDTTLLIADKDKVTEILPEQRILPLGTEQLPSARRTRRSTRRRSRRSAALLLHATLRMCDMHPVHCNSIMLQGRRMRVNIRLVDQ